MATIRIKRTLKNLTATQLLNRVRAYTKKRNFDFTGDEQIGNFAARGFKGHYTVEKIDNREVLVIEVTKKPILVPESLVVSKAEERLASWDSI